MKKESFLSLFPTRKPIIAMVHLGELAGQKGFTSEAQVIEQARYDIEMLQKGGVSGLILENWKEDSIKPNVTVRRKASMKRVVRALAPYIKVPFGVNVLNNDYRAAFEIAHVSGASFVQLDTLVDGVESDFAYNERAKKRPFRVQVDLKDLRSIAKKWNLQDLPILAGIHPKHYTMLRPTKKIETSAKQSEKVGVGGIVITKATGQAPLASIFEKVGRVVSTPLGVGSGLDPVSAPDLLPHAQFAIVGTYLKEDGDTDKPVDLDRVKNLMDVVHELSNT